MSPKNLLQIFKETVARKGAAPCFRFKQNGEWKTITWNEAAALVFDLTGGLKKLGVKRGDKVGILSQSRYEWTLADLAILSCGAVTVPIYQSSTTDQITYILANAEAKVVFVEDNVQLKKVQTARGELPLLKQIVLLDMKGKKVKEGGIYFIDDLLVMGAGEGKNFFEEMALTLSLDTEASYVYTSGTTGPPKGAILTHGNFIAELEALTPVLKSKVNDESLLFLPLAHILARVVQFAQIQRGFIQCYAQSIDTLLDDIAEVKPHFMASVPRIFEKVHTRVMQGVEASSGARRKIFDWALTVGRKRWQYIREGKAFPISLRIEWAMAVRLVFSKLHQKMGARLKFFISGGAPLSTEISEFFHAAGFVILEGYGLTETTAAVTCSTFENIKIGSVGKTLPGVELKIASDGEILVRGDLVFKGYYKCPEATELALDKKGWFHTGDIGVIDSNGFLKITDRKKDIIITAAGKNIAPQNIENIIKTDPLISQVMIHGDRRKYLSALITLDQQEVIAYAKEKQIAFREYAELAKNEKIHSEIQTRLERFNKQLAQYETVKKFAILEADFSVETGELTPTLKVKRKFTSEKYKHILDSFYQEPQAVDHK